jgi:hypothetical protein
MLFAKKISVYISIDKVQACKGGRYTFTTDKAGKSKQAAVIACVNGTRPGRLLTS